MKKRYLPERNPREFLENVLCCWISFCEVNTGLAHAISDLLDENERLQRENAALRRAQNGKR